MSACRHLEINIYVKIVETVETMETVETVGTAEKVETVETNIPAIYHTKVFQRSLPHESY